MSELGPLGEGLAPDAFIRQAISEDLGPTAALRSFREGGGAINNETWFSLYGQIRDAVGGNEALQGLEYSSLPPTEAYSPWAAGEPDRYVSFVEVHVRNPGERIPESRFFSYVTDTMHAPEDAINAAVAEFGEAAAAGGTFAGQIILGATVTSLTRTVRH